jgi:hypothetical protein
MEQTMIRPALFAQKTQDLSVGFACTGGLIGIECDQISDLQK